jgi:hypothetical protein
MNDLSIFNLKYSLQEEINKQVSQRLLDFCKNYDHSRCHIDNQYPILPLGSKFTSKGNRMLNMREANLDTDKISYSEFKYNLKILNQ